MKISAKYSHLNGLEWLVYHHPTFWQEIQDAISCVDASKCRTKVSKEKTMYGKLLYEPSALNACFKQELGQRGWLNATTNSFYVSDDPSVTEQLLELPYEEQKKLLKSLGKPLIRSSNAADFEKDRVSIEVQFGKYSFVQFDLFIKHAANYMHNRIDLGIEIVPMKALEAEMSSGPPYYEKHLHEILRQGRIFPPVPLILIGVEP
ncbi:BglII/BstYI family type II restriction endonuclease [Ruegeria arenilitoris]|uniref:BglII/BstYI family type II restriction endonuclease n=1 Tax=Ruegeria arenilitoris TaxID=1173585 RepID=UPI003C7CD4DF